jgi:Mor family transcriptional regulator
MNSDDDDLKKGDEIVRAIVTQTLAAATTTADADQLVARFLREFGGRRVYLPVNDWHKLNEKRARIFAAALTPKSTERLLQEEGISRATLYRLLKRGP